MKNCLIPKIHASAYFLYFLLAGTILAGTTTITPSVGTALNVTTDGAYVILANSQMSLDLDTTCRNGSENVSYVISDQANISQTSLTSSSTEFKTRFTFQPNAMKNVNTIEVKIVHYQDAGKTKLCQGGATDITVTLLPLQIKEIHFGGDHYHQVSSDSGTAYADPQWTDNNGDGNASDSGEHNYAVAYTQGSTPKIGVTLGLSKASELDASFQIKATGTGGISIPPTDATPGSDTLDMTATASDTTFPTKILYYNKDSKDSEQPFTLNWFISLNGNWVRIGAANGLTNHTLYLTKGDPATSLRQETLFYIGCKQAEGTAGNASADTVTGLIWNRFASRNVTTVDGIQLAYYKSYNTQVTTTDGLLSTGDGQCGSWTRLFLDVCKEQGIADATDNFYIFTPINGDGFIVNNWSFNGAGHSGNINYPYLGLPQLPWPDAFFGVATYNWRYTEVIDEPGISAQGTSNPASFFNNHQMAYINGRFYDASYGVTHTDVQNIQETLAGFYVGAVTASVNEETVNLDLDGDGKITNTNVDTLVYFFQKNSGALNIYPAAHFKY